MSAIYKNMNLLFKKILVNVLVLMVVMLPMRNAFTMPMEMSPDHCSSGMAGVEMSMMNHAGHDMSSLNSSDTHQKQDVVSCACCNQCDGDCTGCVHISSAITFESPHFSNLEIIEIISVRSDSLLTRTISPPSRPPLTL